MHRAENNYNHITCFVKMARGYWNKQETYKAITIWSNNTIQVQLEGCRRNSNVYKKVAKELTEAGHNRTLEQCRDK